MKRFALIMMLAAVNLQACGNPGVIAYTRGVVEERAADREMLAERGVSNKIKSRYYKAIEQFNSAIHFDPKYAPAYHHRAMCRARLGQYDSAEEDFTKTLEMQPANAEAWRERAAIYKEALQFEKAISDYDAADKLEPGDERVYFGRSYCKLYSGDTRGAIEDAQKTVNLEPSAANFCALAVAYRASGNYPEMDKTFDKALQANPHRISTYQTRGFSRFIIGRYSEALSDFKTALESSQWRGSDTPYAVLFGMFSAQFLKQDAEARTLLDEAMKRLSIPAEVDAGAHNAKVAETWPVPAIQYFHRDITEEKFMRAAQGDTSKLTEARTYLGLQALLKGDKKSAASLFQWVAANGRKDYVEFDLSVQQLKSLQTALAAAQKK